MKKLESMSKEDLIKQIKYTRKWQKITVITQITGSSILLIILAVGLWLRLR